MRENPPKVSGKKDEKIGEVIFVDFPRKEILYRSNDPVSEKMTSEEVRRDMEALEKYKKDFIHWLDNLISSMKDKLKEIDDLLNSGGPSHVFRYESYLHLKNDPSQNIIKGKNGGYRNSFDEAELERFEKIEMKEVVFNSYLKTFFRVKNEWETAMRDTLLEDEKKEGSDILINELKKYLENLKFAYKEVEYLEESKIIDKLENFMEEKVKKL